MNKANKFDHIAIENTQSLINKDLLLDTSDEDFIQ